MTPNRFDISDDIRVVIVELPLTDPSIAGVIGRGHKSQITVKLPHQRGHIARSRRNVLLWIERLISAKAPRSRWHQLHQAQSALAGDGAWIPARLDINECSNQLRRYAVAAGVVPHATLGKSSVRLPPASNWSKNKKRKQPLHNAAPPEGSRSCAY